MKVEETIDLPVPPDEVFDVLLDVEQLGDWVTAHRAIVEPPQGPLVEGSRFGQKLRVGGVSFPVRWEVTRLERPRLIEWKGEGPRGSDARVRYALDANGSGTRFDYLNEFRLPGGRLSELAGRAIGEQKARTEARRSLENLKELLAG
jgi:carbon monoxide dehydrogenase subunit G